MVFRYMGIVWNICFVSICLVREIKIPLASRHVVK